MYHVLVKENRRMSTCNQPVGLPNTRVLIDYAQKSPRSLFDKKPESSQVCVCVRERGAHLFSHVSPISINYI